MFAFPETDDKFAVMYEKCYVMTADLHTVPIVVCDATCLNDLYGHLTDWAEVGGLTEASKAMLRKAIEDAHCPNDGLLGTSVSEPFTLPDIDYMKFYVQLV